MTETQNSKQYDLEERTLKFTKQVIKFVKHLPRTIANIEIIKQLVRASGSVGANYIEANEALKVKKILSCELRFAEKKLKKADIG